MLTVADMGEGGVKNLQKSADVLYGRSLSILSKQITSWIEFFKKSMYSI